MKIIPAIDIMEGKVVRLLKGRPENKTVYSDDPIKVAMQWEKNGADMIHIVDLDATLDRGSNFETIKKMAQTLSVPTQIAGGLRTQKMIDKAFEFSERIVLGTVAFSNVDLLDEVSSKFGKKKIVISVDHSDGTVVTHGWQKSEDVSLFLALDGFIQKGFTEFLITNVTRDGTLSGPDLENLGKACTRKANVIASGGISGIADVVKLKECGAYGVILGKALYDGKLTIEEAKTL
ncbi:MAG: 1-(5-phosphoribosyl)-5-[(5-phosphoribosylamino)methylideneamino]imidazole-4-carboxamide isomerase [Candidatus Nitrosotenuis sp.]